MDTQTTNEFGQANILKEDKVMNVLRDVDILLMRMALSEDLVNREILRQEVMRLIRNDIINLPF